MKLLLGLVAAFWLASFAYHPWKPAQGDLAAAHLRLAGHDAGEGRLEDAIAQARKAVRRAPESPIARYNLGWFLVSAGRPAEAEPELRRAIALAPGFAQPRIELARILASRGAREEAAALLEPRNGRLRDPGTPGSERVRRRRHGRPPIRTRRTPR